MLVLWALNQGSRAFDVVNNPHHTAQHAQSIPAFASYGLDLGRASSVRAGMKTQHGGKRYGLRRMGRTLHWR